MLKGQDIAVQFPGLYLVHHNLPGKDVGKHKHDAHLLFLPLKGAIVVHGDGESIAAGPGKMVYLPPKTMHAFTSAQDQGERLIAMISPAAWQKAGGTVLPSTTLATSMLCKELLYYLLLNPSSRNAKPIIDVFIQTLCESFSASGRRTDQGTKHLSAEVTDDRLRKVILLFERDFAENVRLPEIATRAGLSVRSMNRLFATELGRSPKQVLTAIRMEHAQRLLRHPRATVTDTALACGYGSLSQFIKTFREVTGHLPSAFTHPI